MIYKVRVTTIEDVCVEAENFDEAFNKLMLGEFESVRLAHKHYENLNKEEEQKNDNF